VNTESNSQNRFLHYLGRARRRENTRIFLVWIAWFILLLLAVTAIGVLTGLVRGFTPDLTNTTRLGLIFAAIFAFSFWLFKPIARLRRDRGAHLIESSDAEFDGRVQTYLDTEENAPDHKFLPLLAQDGLSVAKRVPMYRIVPMSSILWPLVFISALLFVTVGFFQRAPLEWRNAAQHIWSGWKTPGLVATRDINAECQAVRFF